MQNERAPPSDFNGGVTGNQVAQLDHVRLRRRMRPIEPESDLARVGTVVQIGVAAPRVYVSGQLKPP